MLSGAAPSSPIWCHNIWKNPEVITISSINDGANKLKERGRNWILYPHKEIRRAKLIQEALPHVSLKAIAYPETPPKGKLGSFTLMDRDTILASSDCSSPFPNGEPNFLESKSGPPSRAYLKLWEAFTLLGVSPKKGERCLDAGACPGGWSWVLQGLGADILAIDKAPLDLKMNKFSNIKFQKGDALAKGPDELGSFDWVFSDVICYPERLLQWIKLWISSGATKHILCSVKFRGEEGYGVLAELKKIPNSWIRHLFVNKHEVTFYWKQ